MHVDNKKYILALPEFLTQGLDDTTIRAQVKYPINFTQSGIRCLHFNESNSLSFVNAVKM